ncbi:hypothetical protein CFK39_06160 [Brachybacterium avium]|uniref:Uncharacterized protein n=1 Tax=Brachybacterium avium TaxID=2017485 RepID=A0A220UCN1_9MICO|nr:hypothetical protein CFK39_06160 [Brachybacterium avium]
MGSVSTRYQASLLPARERAIDGGSGMVPSRLPGSSEAPRRVRAGTVMFSRNLPVGTETPSRSSAAELISAKRSSVRGVAFPEARTSPSGSCGIGVPSRSAVRWAVWTARADSSTCFHCARMTGIGPLICMVPIPGSILGNSSTLRVRLSRGSGRSSRCWSRARSFFNRVKKRSGLISGDQAATAISRSLRESSVNDREDFSIFWNQVDGRAPDSSAARQRGNRCTA